MYMEQIITVIIPTFKVSKHINKVIKTLPNFIDNIIVIDDFCPDKSYSFISNMNKVNIIHHTHNKGVGGAVISGYIQALKINSDIIIKIDGDGQMNPLYIENLITVLIDNKLDYAKGNRFFNLEIFNKMPLPRLIGNLGLSFIVKVVSGYYGIKDPTNGFTAISKQTLIDLDFSKLANRYFFETDMLINLNILNKKVKDVNIPAIYEDEESNLSVINSLVTFPLKLIKGFFKRIYYKYIS